MTKESCELSIATTSLISELSNWCLKSIVSQVKAQRWKYLWFFSSTYDCKPLEIVSIICPSWKESENIFPIIFSKYRIVLFFQKKEIWQVCYKFPHFDFIFCKIMHVKKWLQWLSLRNTVIKLRQCTQSPPGCRPRSTCWGLGCGCSSRPLLTWIDWTLI